DPKESEREEDPDLSELPSRVGSNIQTPLTRTRITAGISARSPTYRSVRANSPIAFGSGLDCALRPTSINTTPPPTQTMAATTCTRWIQSMVTNPLLPAHAHT